MAVRGHLDRCFKAVATVQERYLSLGALFSLASTVKTLEGHQMRCTGLCLQRELKQVIFSSMTGCFSGFREPQRTGYPAHSTFFGAPPTTPRPIFPCSQRKCLRCLTFLEDFLMELFFFCEHGREGAGAASMPASCVATVSSRHDPAPSPVSESYMRFAWPPYARHPPFDPRKETGGPVLKTDPPIFFTPPAPAQMMAYAAVRRRRYCCLFR